MNRFFKVTIYCVVGLLLTVSPALAQETASSLRGKVVDATGAPLPGAQVSRVLSPVCTR